MFALFSLLFEVVAHTRVRVHTHTPTQKLLRVLFPVLPSCTIISTMHSQQSHLLNYMYLVENT